MKTTAFVITALLFSSIALAEFGWEGKPWKLSQLKCPFGCSETIKSEYAKSSSKPVLLDADKVALPEFFASCVAPVKPKWDSIQKTDLKSYLEKWSSNEKANKKPKTKKHLAEKLGLKPDLVVSAGVVQCSDGTAFNLFVINLHQAFLIFEENSYFELTR